MIRIANESAFEVRIEGKLSTVLILLIQLDIDLVVRNRPLHPVQLAVLIGAFKDLTIELDLPDNSVLLLGDPVYRAEAFLVATLPLAIFNIFQQALGVFDFALDLLELGDGQWLDLVPKRQRSSARADRSRVEHHIDLLNN